MLYRKCNYDQLPKEALSQVLAIARIVARLPESNGFVAYI